MSLAGLVPGAAVHLASRIATVALGLAVVVAVARQGPEVQGAFTLFVAVESALLALCSGFGLALARGVSHRGDDPAPLLRAWLRVALAVGVVTAAALFAASRIATQPPYGQLGWLALAAPVLLVVPTASGLWLGRGQMVRLSAPQVALPLAVLAALGLAAVSRGDGHGALALAEVLAAWVASRVLVGLGSLAASLREAPPSPGMAPRPALALLRDEWRFVAAVGAANVVAVLNYRVPLFVVEHVRGLDATGVYAVAVQLAELLWLLSAALSTAAYRRIGAPDRAQAARVALQATGWGVAATLLAAPLLWVAAWAWLPLLVGAAYADALRPLALLLPGVVLYAAASAMSAFFTNHLGQPQWAARIAALSLVLNTLGCLWAVPRWGLDGAAASTSLSYALAIAVAWTQFARAAGVPWHAPWVARADRQSPP
jgi:O-antigen/teichoic acid export membrane protein